MEQDIQDEDKLLLRFKYNVFFDLNPKVRDPKMIHLKPAEITAGQTWFEVLELNWSVYVCVHVFVF